MPEAEIFVDGMVGTSARGIDLLTRWSDWRNQRGPFAGQNSLRSARYAIYQLMGTVRLSDNQNMRRDFIYDERSDHSSETDEYIERHHLGEDAYPDDIAGPHAYGHYAVPALGRRDNE